MKKSPSRKSGFLNQLEKRKLRRLGMLQKKQQTHPPSNVSFPQGDSIKVRIPPEQELKEELRNILSEGQFKIPKPSKEDIIK